MQVVRPNKNIGRAETNNDITHYVDVPDTIMSTLKRCCYDCHSNNTDYPWYTEINPIGHWMNKHVQEGKNVFNFSDFSIYSKPQLSLLLQRIGSATVRREVPLKSYLLMHKDAALSEKDIKDIVLWTNRERTKIEAH